VKDGEGDEDSSCHESCCDVIHHDAPSSVNLFVYESDGKWFESVEQAKEDKSEKGGDNRWRKRQEKSEGKIDTESFVNDDIVRVFFGLGKDEMSRKESDGEQSEREEEVMEGG
jgi:hypothetical protein